MKKLLFLLAALTISSTVQAANLTNGPYLAGHVGFDYTDYKAGDVKDDDTRFAWDVAFGVRVRNVRTEAQWANTTRGSIKDTDVEQQRYMAQFYYDLPIRSVVRPFLNAGLGAAYTEITYKNGNKKKTADDTTFCWNVGAGIGINVTRYFSFDIGYRYIDAGRAKFKKEADSMRARSHEGYAGVRFTF